MNLVTSNPAHEGIYTVSLTVSLQNYTGIPSITKTPITITVNCVVTSLSFNAGIPTTQIVNIGIDSQPFSIPFSVTKTLACASAPTFSISPALGFVTIS